MYRCDSFIIQELVSKQVYDKYKEKSWEFFNPELLMTIDKIKLFFKNAVIVNDWVWGGSFQQRGLRSNLDDIVLKKTNHNKLYLSQHVLGNAVDFNIKGISSETVRNEIIKNQENFKYITYMEKDVSWVHIDCRNSKHEGIYLFR